MCHLEKKHLVGGIRWTRERVLLLLMMEAADVASVVVLEVRVVLVVFERLVLFVAIRLVWVRRVYFAMRVAGDTHWSERSV